MRVCDHEDGEAHGGVTTGLDAGQPYTAAFSGLLTWDFDEQQPVLRVCVLRWRRRRVGQAGVVARPMTLS